MYQQSVVWDVSSTSLLLQASQLYQHKRLCTTCIWSPRTFVDYTTICAHTYFNWILGLIYNWSAIPMHCICILLLLTSLKWNLNFMLSLSLWAWEGEHLQMLQLIFAVSTFRKVTLYTWGQSVMHIHQIVILYSRILSSFGFRTPGNLTTEAPNSAQGQL